VKHNLHLFFAANKMTFASWGYCLGLNYRKLCSSQDSHYLIFYNWNFIFTHTTISDSFASLRAASWDMFVISCVNLSGWMMEMKISHTNGYSVSFLNIGFHR
jgi:hypothetical protein